MTKLRGSPCQRIPQRQMVTPAKACLGSDLYKGGAIHYLTLLYSVSAAPTSGNLKSRFSGEMKPVLLLLPQHATDTLSSFLNPPPLASTDAEQTLAHRARQECGL